jgi:hypothetical protein
MVRPRKSIRLAVPDPRAESRARRGTAAARSDHAPAGAIADRNDSDDWQDWPADESGNAAREH